MKKNRTDVAVIGGGAAGCFAAITAARRGLGVIVVEQNGNIGRKLRITGKGRCNLTNLCEPGVFIANVPRNGKFLYSAVNALSPGDTVRMFEDMGLPLKIERGNRVFPVSDSSLDVIAVLKRALDSAGVGVITGKAAGIILEDGAAAGLRLNNGEIFCNSVIIATGGVSYRATGSTGDGFRFARELGHNVTAPRPSLIPLEEDGFDCAELMGLSLKNVRLNVFENGREIYRDFGELLFTHFGLSGPVVLSASAHMRRFGEKSYAVSIDLKPALDEEALDKRLLSDFAKKQNSDFINSLDALLPQKLIPVAVRRSGIDARQKVNSITTSQRQALLSVVKSFTVKIKGPRPINEAIITSGGVDVREINPRTMRSKLVPRLFFAGEVIDADAYTGGFNLQIAWSTAYLAGKFA
jgi:predicted Rossmann fold flavoprotein